MSPAPVTAIICGNLNLIRCFADTSLTPALVTWDANNLALHSRYARRQVLIANPDIDPQRALEDFITIGQVLPHRPALFYDDEAMLLFTSRHRDVLEKHFRFLIPDPQLVEDLTNKVRFAALAERLNLPVPRTLLSRQTPSARAAAATLDLPCIFKPISHVGWYDTDIVQQAGAKPFKALLASTPDQFDRLWDQMTRYSPDFVIQEYIPGADNCIYSFHAYLDRNSRPLGHYVGRKLRTYPKVSGISTYLELVHEPQVQQLALEILAKMNFVGPVKLDFKKDHLRNRFYLLEINARFSLWNYLGAACGINLPHIAYLDLHDRAPQPSTSYRTNIRWLSFDNDLRAFLRDYRPDGDLSLPRWLWSLRGRKVYNVFSWRDPLPAAVRLLRYFKNARKYWRKLTHRPPTPLPPTPAPLSVK